MRKYTDFRRKPCISKEEYQDIPTNCKGFADEIGIFYKTSGFLLYMRDENLNSYLVFQETQNPDSLGVFCFIKKPAGEWIFLCRPILRTALRENRLNSLRACQSFENALRQTFAGKFDISEILARCLIKRNICGKEHRSSILMDPLNSHVTEYVFRRDDDAVYLDGRGPEYHDTPIVFRLRQRRREDEAGEVDELGYKNPRHDAEVTDSPWIVDSDIETARRRPVLQVARNATDEERGAPMWQYARKRIFTRKTITFYHDLFSLV